ncbi:hypothetical protein HAHE_22660 [Haloferula helveola]|uniref:Cytochrome c domain-containing protein n=1 Tax=Haloferula helveola TaxID=490095 RepID=A0ABM7RCY1_9BACT|nr:hypothetical protein HAHE_22660 [Haloferula helveola]
MTRRILIPIALSGTALAIPEGFEIHDFAGPPNADYPAAITVAPNGDVYVSSDQNGSLGKQKDMGRIIRCRDTDGDGKADDFVHFVPTIDSPRGGHIVGDTLYLIHPPYLSSFRDTDGDGVADEKKLLVTGFGGGIEHPRGADHTTNGVRMGIDGWLYVSVGDFGMADAKGADGKRYTLFGGGVARVRPDGSELEPYALMTRNICDTAISPTLDLFSRDNTNDGKGWNTRFHHYTALGDHGYPRLYKNFADEAIQPLADYGGGSGTGGLWVDEPGLPGEFGNMLYSCDWTTGNVYYHKSKREGASFSIEQEVFHKTPRATDIDVDGFSRLYIADWRGGKFNFAGKGKPVGMIQQVTATGDGGAKYEDVTKADDAKLVTLLASASGVQRFEAQREILRRGKKPAFAEGVFGIAKDTKQSVEARVAAVFTLKQLYGTESTRYIAELVADDDLREFALRAMTDRLTELEGVPVDAYTKALTDPNARVVLQALVGLQRLGAKDAAPAILQASTDWSEQGSSPRLAHTAVATLTSLANVPALIAGAEDTAQRKIALGALQHIHSTEAVDSLLALIGRTGDAELRFAGLSALARLHYDEKPWDLKMWWGTRPDDRGPYYETVDWERTPKIRTALERGYTMVPEALRSTYLDTLAKNRIPVSELKLEGLDPVMAALGASKPTDAQIGLLINAAKNPKLPFPRRVECYKALNRGPAQSVTVSRLAVLAEWSQEKGLPDEVGQHIDDFVNETERGAEVNKLRQLAAKQSDAVSRIAWKSLLTVLNSPLAKDKWKEEVKKHIDKNPREVGFFLALADLKLPGFEKQIEVGLSFDNDELIAAAKAAKEATASAASAGKKVAELSPEEVTKAAMSGHGDVETGKRLFTAQGCIACHAVDPQAEQKGPYLGSAGSKFTRDYLIESILDPNKVVSQGFQTSMITMKDGATHMGFVTAEADGIVEIRNIAGQVTKLKRADIAKDDHLPQSMMPPGLAGNLSLEEFISMIDYLGSLQTKGG